MPLKTGAQGGGFGVAVEIILKIEGVHNVDGGGDTWYGIARNFHPNEPWPPTRERAIEIYKHEYWDAAHCDAFAFPVALALFDSAVNQGVQRAVKALQEALHVFPDGVVGNATIAAANNVGMGEVLARFMGTRALAYAKHQPESERFGLMCRLFRTMWSAALLS